MQFRSAKHATDGGTSRRFLDRFHTPRTSSKRRRAPVLEMLEGRTLLSISASSPISSTTIGVLTFSDTGSTSNDQLTLYKSSDGFAAVYDNGTGSATYDYPSSDGVTSIVVDLSGHAGTTLTLGSASQAAEWDFASEPITYTGNGSTSTLQTYGTTSPHTWTLTDTYAGNIDATYNSTTLAQLTGVSFTNVGFLAAGSGATDTLVGESSAASTWTLGTTANSGTYSDGITPESTTPVTFSGFDTLTAGSGATDTLVGESSATSTWTLTTLHNAKNGTYGDGTTTVNFTNFNTLTAGSSATDTLVGETSATSTWTLTSANNGTYNDGTTTVNFNNFSTLTSASTTTNELVGESDVTSTWTMGTTANSGTYSDGTNTINFNNFSTLTAQSGSLTTNTLVGAYNHNTTWYVGTTANSGTYHDGTKHVDFTGFDSLKADPYTTNTLIGKSTPSTWKLVANANTGTYGVGTSTVTFTGFDTLTPGMDNEDTLTGEDVASIWTLGASSITYYDGTKALTIPITGNQFKTLEAGGAGDTFYVSTTFPGSLQGGTTGHDVFNLMSGGSVTGGIHGESGDSTINYYVPEDVTVTSFDGIGYSSTTSNFTGINTVNARGTGNTLTGDNNVTLSTWTLGDSAYTYLDPTGNSSTSLLTFSGFGTLQGGTSNNTFTVSTAFFGSLDGGGTTPGSVTIFNLNGGSVTGSIVGQSGKSTIEYPASTIEYPVGVTVTGLDSVGTPIGYSGTDTVDTGGFSGINTVTDTGSGNTLTGDNNASTWTLAAGTGGYTYKDITDGSTLKLTFSGFGTLQGGTSNNTFTVSTAFVGSLDGGGTTSGSATIFDLNGGSVSGGIVGQSGDSTINYTAAVNVMVSAPDSVGFSGNEEELSISGGFTGINTVNATGTGNTLTGDNIDSTWALAAAVTMNNTYSDITGTSLNFSGFNTLQGGEGSNEFDVYTTFSGSLHGGGTSAAPAVFNLYSGGSVGNGVSTGIVGDGGNSTINYFAAVTVTVSAPDSVGYSGNEATSVSGGFTGINTVNAEAGGTLIGDSHASTWDLGAATYKDTTDIYTPSTLTFSGFGTLQGAPSASDTFKIDASSPLSLNLVGGNGDFVFTPGGTLNGTIKGLGTGTLDYSSCTTPVTVNLGTSMSTGTRGISGINNLIGGSHTTLVGPNAVTIWTISGANAGSLGSGSFTFNTVQNLSGGVLKNTFDLDTNGSVSGTITGGSTGDILDLSQSSNAATVNVTNNNAGNVHINGPTVLNFSRIPNVKGTTGNDTFVLSNGKGLTGSLNGDGGSDTLSYAAYTTSVRVNLSAGVATGIYGGISNGIVKVTGGYGNDILIGSSTGSSVLDGGPGGNDILVGLHTGSSLTVHGGGRNILIGGLGNNTLDSSAATGENLLIGGSVASFDTNVAALNSLMAEWSRTGVSFDTRRAHLNGTLAGGLNGNYKLTTGTVTADTSSTLKGNSSGGNTWFIANETTGITEKSGDVVDAA